MDGAWKQFLHFTEKNFDDDIEKHRDCLDTLKAGIWEALNPKKTALNPRCTSVVADDAKTSLLLIERTLQGQTCAFGNHMFGFRQACIVLLKLLKLLPEPVFEPVSSELVGMAAQLVGQLGRQEFFLLSSFVSDCVDALRSARERPFKINAFPKLVRRCKAAMGEDPAGAAKGGMPGMVLELSTAERLSTFCARLLRLTMSVVHALAPFVSSCDLELLPGMVLGLASDTVVWAEQTSFEVAESARIVSSCVQALHGLWLDGAAPGSEGPAPAPSAGDGAGDAPSTISLHGQISVLVNIPHVAAFVLKECKPRAVHLLLDLVCYVVSVFDDAMLFPRLHDVLRPFWPGTAASTACLRVVVAAASRFGAVAVPAAELWQCLRLVQACRGPMELDVHAALSRAFQLLELHAALCAHAVSSCTGHAQNAGGGPDGYSNLIVLALAMRATPPAEIESAPQGSACSQAHARFMESARAVFSQKVPLEQPEVHLRAIQIVFDTLLAHPVCISKLEREGKAFVDQLVQIVSAGRPAPALWHVFNLALHIFVVSSPAHLAAKYRLLHESLSKSPSKAAKSKAAKAHYVESAAWVAMSHALFAHIEERFVKGMSSKEHAEDQWAYKQILNILGQKLKSDKALHQSVLVAIAYIFPLLVTYAFTVPGLYERGDAKMMPDLADALGPASPYTNGGNVLSCMCSPSRSMLNPLKAAPAFSLGPEDSQLGAKTRQLYVSLPAPCPFCDRSHIEGVAHERAAAAAERTWCGPACPNCGMEVIQLNWRMFALAGSGDALRLLPAWEQFRHGSADLMPGTNGSDSGGCCWLRSTRELLEIFTPLCKSLLENLLIKPLRLLEPSDSQERVQKQSTHDMKWLLSCGLFGLCVLTSGEQLEVHASTIFDLFRLILPKYSQRVADWESAAAPNPLLALAQSNAFVATLLQLGKGKDLQLAKTSGCDPAKNEACQKQLVLQKKCHQWRLDVFGAPGSLSSELADAPVPGAANGAPQLESLPPALFHVIFADASKAVMTSALERLVAGSVVARGRRPAPTQARPETTCLQLFFAFSMLRDASTDDLFCALQGNMYLRLFERYSRQNSRVASLCQLLLRGPLKLQVRSLLSKIIPAMVLRKNMQTIQDLCALLEESVQSLFTPQLPYIISAIAQQPVQNVANAFMFILDSVYNMKMTIANICDASLGKVLVLILWNSAMVEGEREAHESALSAIHNIVSALKAHNAPGGELDRKRKLPNGAGTALVPTSGAAAGPPAKRSKPGGGGGGVIDVAGEIGDSVPPEVVQTLEGSFLHVLDILEIVLTGNRQSPKWAEYSPLLRDPHGGDSMDYGRLFTSIALLFELVPESLHRFGPKILEFLQSATAQSDYQAESARCWGHFVRFVGVPRLKPLIPAIVGELLRLAAVLKRHAPDKYRQLCEGLLSSLVESTCRQHADLVASIPSLPQWPELAKARAVVDSAGQHKASTFAEKLEVGVAHLESATQQAVRRAALDHIDDLIASQRSVSPRGINELSTTLLARLIRSLLKFLWESSAWPNDQFKCGKVLGAIGAIDPCRFSHLDLGESHSARLPQDLGNMELLARRVLADFLVPNLTSTNSYAFAVQEILKHLQSCGQWQRITKDLSEDMRQTLHPYLDSSYQLIRPAQLFGDTSTFEGVVAQAVALLQGEHRAFFEACLPAVHGNHALALFLMHHAVHHLLASNTSLEGLDQLSRSLADLLESPKHSTAQAVFALVDDIIHRREQLQLDLPTMQRPADVTAKKRQMQRVEQIKKPITNRKIVAASVRCGAHARALQFLEEAIIEEAQGNYINPFDDPQIKSEDDCLLLQSIYNDLDEPDGVLGALRIGPATAKTRTLQLEHAGRWHDVQACYEEQLSLMVTSGTNNAGLPERGDLLYGLVRCGQNMRRFESSLRLIQGMEEDSMHTKLRPLAVEAAWQLSSWDRLQGSLEIPNAHEGSDDFQVKLGQALLAFHQNDKDCFKAVLKETTLQVTRTVASAARESYVRAYQHLLKLHVLADIKWLANCRDAGDVNRRAFAENFLMRAEATAPTFAARQLVLSPLRVALMDMNLIDDGKRVELEIMRICRKHRVPFGMEHPSTSFSKVSPELFMRAQLEWGKSLYARGSRHDALQHMQELAKKHPKAGLLGTRWATEASSELLIPKVAEAEFKDVKEKLPEYEAAWFFHASYLDQLLKDQLLRKNSGGAADAARMLQRKQSSSSICPFDQKKLVTFTLRGYLQALHRGNKRLHFILNRVLQLTWDCCELDFHKQEALAEIESQAKSMEPWKWYVVLPQLISRVHNPDMTALFKQLIMNVLVQYPHQAGWQMVQLLKSSDNEHQKLGKQMLLDVSRRKKEVHRSMAMCYQVCDQLNALATFNPPDNKETMNLGVHFPKLTDGSANRAEVWSVLVPLQSQMTAAVPRVHYQHEAKVPFNPFPTMITTARCLETVDVFRTKERPKKVTFLGSDGKRYPFLCKAERRGDLRKDSRMMEFGAMVNQLLQKNPDARRRNLEVRTFNVVIFAESCGLIEWVSNTRGMRHIIDDLWKRLRPGGQQSVREIKDMFDRSKDLYETFTKQVLPRHPPVLYKWFGLNADPSVWVSKRIAFSRSQALWCMLGYMLGLGDRHGENILLDTESGRMVQVDFDCLFGKGMLLERPETVPFRLTQNCVAAMGVTGVEGIFRQSCELCMDVMRDRGNRQTLLSVLHVFIADPLIEWTARSKDKRDDERGIQLARTTIGDIEKKLNGMLNVGAVVNVSTSKDSESVLSSEELGRGLLGRDRGVGLSVAGQVDELLKAAMCKRNLSEMYVGWQPWM